MSLFKSIFIFIALATLSFFSGCSSEEPEEHVMVISSQDAVLRKFEGKINLEDLPNYANQNIPTYISKDNTNGNAITDGGAVLGRVLFYDKNLSSNNTISCASCHQQSFAFGDGAVASTGVNGTTGRHSMRLVNARFSDENNFFWDERANTLEGQTTQPIQDHIEMGFSGENGDENLDVLLDRLESIDYYNELFTFVYGDAQVTENRMQTALAQFIRSIQSFDSKYDIGRARVNNNNSSFPNFTELENTGKDLFAGRPDLNNNGIRVGGGLGCNTCHRAPEFDIDPDSRNNGVISSLDGSQDTEVTRSPTLRDLLNQNGNANGPYMHNGFSDQLEDVLAHYNDIGNNIDGLDRRLQERGNGQNLMMTTTEIEAIIAFLETLTGSDVYTNEKWSDPFPNE
ncbi:MAG: cytochrome-c peroxidase [Ekhidna sp.]|nr:cytochrome-c peroxidase [Ekhidna sp.]